MCQRLFCLAYYHTHKVYIIVKFYESFLLGSKRRELAKIFPLFSSLVFSNFSDSVDFIYSNLNKFISLSKQVVQTCSENNYVSSVIRKIKTNVQLQSTFV